MKGAKPPGTYLKSEELKRLPGLVEYKPLVRYEYSLGQALSRFLEGLRRGRILGTQCPRCNRVYVPPRVYCEYCFASVNKWVEVPGTGRVVSAVVSYISAFRERLERPEIIAVIRLDAPGYAQDSYEFPGLFHKLCGVSEDDVVTGKIIGAKVRAKWRPEGERTGSITDIECFVPVGEGGD